MAEEATLRVDGPVATLTICRAARGNSLSGKTLADLRRHLGEVVKLRAVRVLVLTGEGKVFCSGMDLSAQNQVRGICDCFAVFSLP